MADDGYGISVRVSREVHELAKLIAARYRVTMIDVFDALVLDRGAAIVKRMAKELEKKEARTDFPTVLKELFDVDWRPPPESGEGRKK